MGRFSAFEDPALQGRIERSRRAEKDLQERVQARIDQVEKEGRWLRSDPLYQPLSSLLRKVGDELREAEQELLAATKHVFSEEGRIARESAA